MQIRSKLTKTLDCVICYPSLLLFVEDHLVLMWFPWRICVSYFIKCDNKATRVCQKFFFASLSISKQRVNTVAKVLLAGGVSKENRGGDSKSQKSEVKNECVRHILKRLKGRESHYNRKKSKRIYLSASMSVAKLWRSFNKEYPQKWVSYCIFRKNIRFSSSASDVSSKCT